MRKLAATQNKGKKTLTVIVDVPYVYLPELLKHKELTITWKKIKDIEVNNVLDNPFIPTWDNNSETLNQMWLEFLKGADSKMAIDVNSNTTISSVNFDVSSSEASGWIVDYKKLGITDMNYYLNKHTRNNLLLTPFAYTTCIITSSNWDSFFEEFCPKYKISNEDGSNPIIGKSKREISELTDCLYDPSTLDKCNILLTIPQELQEIAEQIYDIWNGEFEENEYHIPFEEQIDKMEYLGEEGMDGIYGHIKYKYPASEYSFPDKYAILLKKCKLTISASMCSKFSTEGTLEDHLNNEQPFTHQIYNESRK